MELDLNLIFKLSIYYFIDWSKLDAIYIKTRKRLFPPDAMNPLKCVKFCVWEVVCMFVKERERKEGDFVGWCHFFFWGKSL